MNNHVKKILLTISLCFLLFFLCSCQNKEEKAIQHAIKAELDQLKSTDTKTIQNYITTQDLLPYSENFQELAEDVTSVFTMFYKDFHYETGKITIEEDKASAKVKLYIIDTQKLAKDFSMASLKKRIEQNTVPNAVEFSAHDSYLVLKNILKNNNYKTKAVTADIQLLKVKNSWQVIHSSELNALLTGNFVSYVTDCNLLSPKEIVKTHFDTIKHFDAEQLKVYLSLDTLLETEDEYSVSVAHAIADQINNFFDFKILEESTEDTAATVKVSIVSVDFHSIIETYKEELSKWLETSESLSEGSEGRREKEREMLLSCIEQNQATISHDINIQLINDGVNWKIQMNEELSKAVFGDIQAAVDSLYL